jgi:effector-binding domain-containing protein
MPYTCEIKDQPAQAALSIRARTRVQDLPRTLGESYAKIGQFLEQIGEGPAGPPFTAYFNMDMEDLDIEVGFPVARPLDGKGEIQASELPGGQVGTCLFTGPYPELATAYEALTRFIQDQGFQPTGVAYEQYFNDPGKVPPEELQTLILFPLK